MKDRTMSHKSILNWAMMLVGIVKKVDIDMLSEAFFSKS